MIFSSFPTFAAVTEAWVSRSLLFPNSWGYAVGAISLNL